MKKQMLLIAVLLVSLASFSQQTHRVMGWKVSQDLPQNELKLNLGTTIFGSFPEITYERILNSDVSAGASLGFSLDKELYPLDIALIPYVRWFFGGSAENLQKYGAGFFIEANAALFSKETEEIDYQNETANSITENNAGAGLGIAIGWKYQTRNNWVGELYFGGGRDFANDGAYPRLGITIGKRF